MRSGLLDYFTIYSNIILFGQEQDMPLIDSAQSSPRNSMNKCSNIDLTAFITKVHELEAAVSAIKKDVVKMLSLVKLYSGADRNIRPDQNIRPDARYIEHLASKRKKLSTGKEHINDVLTSLANQADKLRQKHLEHSAALVSEAYAGQVFFLDEEIDVSEDESSKAEQAENPLNIMNEIAHFEITLPDLCLEIKTLQNNLNIAFENIPKPRAGCISRRHLMFNRHRMTASDGVLLLPGSSSDESASISRTHSK